MKSFIKVFVLIALVAAIGFSMAACGGDDGGGSGGGGGGGGGGNSLAGTTWKCTQSVPYYGSITSTLTFTTDTRVKMDTFGGTYNGTYTVKGSSVTVNWDPGYTGSGSYSLSGNRLTDSDGNVFTKL